MQALSSGSRYVARARTPMANLSPGARSHPPTFAEWPQLLLTDDAASAARTGLIANHPAMTPPIAIDARMKPWYPEELFCDPDTAALVDRRWKEYFPDAQVEMGDSDRGHLD